MHVSLKESSPQCKVMRMSSKCYAVFVQYNLRAALKEPGRDVAEQEDAHYSKWKLFKANVP